MIPLSRRRRWLMVAMLTIPSLVGLACTLTCTDVGCIDGLNVRLAGGFDPDKTYTVALSEVNVAGQTTALISCARTWPSTGGATMDCISSLRFNADPFVIQISDESIRRNLRKLRVVISQDSAVVGQQDYDVAFETREINGPGCGDCTNANLMVDFPVRPVWGQQGQEIRAAWCKDDLGDGGFSFTATRNQLSSEQIRQLSEMQAVADPTPSCSGQENECGMEVLYHDGRVAFWYARPSDASCPIPDRPNNVISHASFQPFRQTLGCWGSKRLGNAASDAAAGVGSIPILSPSAICRHGLAITPGTTTNIGIAVPDGPGDLKHHLALHLCSRSLNLGDVELQLYDETGATMLAQGTVVDVPSDDTCRVIDHTYPTAGVYLMKVIVAPSYVGNTLFVAFE